MTAQIISIADRRRAPRLLSEADKKRLYALLVRDLAFDLGRGEEMEARYGKLHPMPGDAELRPRAGLMLPVVPR